MVDIISGPSNLDTILPIYIGIGRYWNLDINLCTYEKPSKIPQSHQV